MADVVKLEKPATEFKSGDTVRLKGGGFEMTVRFFCSYEAAKNAGTAPGVMCDWHTDGGSPCTETYHEDQLCLVH